jgi:methylated-DNA-[protein]-cysteine S-methyltransferase
MDINTPKESSKTSQAFVESPLGWIQVSATTSNIKAISFVDAEGQSETSPLLSACCEALSSYFKGELTEFDLPLDPDGTEFQKRVWKELQVVEHGETISYLELSRRLGDEKLTRAVGSANGSNPIAIVIPCHRIIGNDGSLTGYAGGIDKKEKLLRLEGALEQLSLF